LALKVVGGELSRVFAVVRGAAGFGGVVEKKLGWA
jgi:hypothetical protein